MAASLLLRSLRRREVLNSSLAAHKVLTGSLQSAYPSSAISRGASLARLFSSKPPGNEVIGIDLGTTNLAGHIESAYPISQVARLFSSKPSGNEVSGMVKNETKLQQNDKGTKALIGIKVTSFDGRFMGIPPHTKKVGLPESRVVYTVLRSPHIDKKSREQFEMRIKKLYLVIKTDSHELRNKYFWLKRQRIFGAQFEVNFFCKTRLDKARLDGLLGR